jgi:hypothetical protein
MFDPYFIGKVDRRDVKVLTSLGAKRIQMLKVVMKLGDNYHILILKPNLERYRDQIVIDRLKHVFNLTPMHTFGVELDFVYSGGLQHDVDSMEYFAFASQWKEECETLDDQISLSVEHKEKVLMILMFRYVVGALNTSGEHILLKRGKLISISEGRFATGGESNSLAPQFADLSGSIWAKSRDRLLKGVLLDNIRGIVLQSDNPTNNIDRKASQGPLSIPVRRIMTNIESRLDILKTASIKDLKDLSGVF